jgi:hypothetical protein
MTEEQQPSPGPQTPSAGATYEEELRTARIANRFDIRRIIGGLFLLYGVVFCILGLQASDAGVRRADGINVGLWVGISLLVTAALFIAWALMRPLGASSKNELAPGDRFESDRFLARARRVRSGGRRASR